MITIKDYLTASGQYPEREKDKECTTEVIANAKELLDKVNLLLEELGSKSAKVSSGFRPSAVNAGIANAAKKSLHQTGKAIDIIDDKEQSLCKKILARPELLKKYGLWMEDPSATKGKNTNWCHLDCGVRKDRPIRVFKP